MNPAFDLPSQVIPVVELSIGIDVCFTPKPKNQHLISKRSTLDFAPTSLECDVACKVRGGSLWP